MLNNKLATTRILYQRRESAKSLKLSITFKLTWRWCLIQKRRCQSHFLRAVILHHISKQNPTGPYPLAHSQSPPWDRHYRIWGIPSLQNRRETKTCGLDSNSPSSHEASCASTWQKFITLFLPPMCHVIPTLVASTTRLEKSNSTFRNKQGPIQKFLLH